MQINTIQALNWALDDALAADPNVVLFGEEMADPEGGGIMKVSAGLSTKYGGRVRSTPISEMGFSGAAVGAAIAGMRLPGMGGTQAPEAYDKVITKETKSKPGLFTVHEVNQKYYYLNSSD